MINSVQLLDFYPPLKSLLLLALVPLLLLSCSDVNFNAAETGKGKINVHLTDAPGEYEEVNIDVQSLRIHYTPASSDTASGEGKWIDLPVEPFTTDLLELNNGIDTLLASAELDPGTYRELRMVLGGNNNVVVDGQSYNLKVPSGQASGYKIKFSTELEPEEELDITIDFDAARSVHQAGKSGKFILKPVVKAFVENGDDTQTGTIVGTVLPADADPTIWAIMEDDTSGSTQPNEEGDFALVGLTEGMYDLSIEAMNEQYQDSTLEDVSVTAGEETDIGSITLEQSDQ
ncbi:MAG: DUF4382 domain-containing protein [Balneolaceae bacterium]|nr:DUF4382 domain-containing protein [Balneolaceae bacterium]